MAALAGMGGDVMTTMLAAQIAPAIAHEQVLGDTMGVEADEADRWIRR